MSAEKLIEGLETRKLSILKCAGGRKQRIEMFGVGLLCRFVLAMARVFSGGGNKAKDIMKMRKKLADFLKWAAPYKIEGKPDRKAKCLVMGFNHPSLGEVIRFVHVHLRRFPDRYSLFPVNLPWYEALAPKSDILFQMGIVLVPILTPSTMKKLKERLSKSDIDALTGIKDRFNNHYMSTIKKMALEDRCVIWVAPSATRQATLFNDANEKNDISRIGTQTMTLLALTLKRAKVSDCEFVPVGVAPSKKCGRGLNLRKEYRLSFAPSMDWPEVERNLDTKSTRHRGNMMEHSFLTRISWALSRLGRHDLVCSYKEAS